MHGRRVETSIRLPIQNALQQLSGERHAPSVSAPTKVTSSDDRVTTRDARAGFRQPLGERTERVCYQLDSAELNWTGKKRVRFPLALPSFQ